MILIHEYYYINTIYYYVPIWAHLVNAYGHSFQPQIIMYALINNLIHYFQGGGGAREMGAGRSSSQLVGIKHVKSREVNTLYLI